VDAVHADQSEEGGKKAAARGPGGLIALVYLVAQVIANGRYQTALEPEHTSILLASVFSY
jgi:hypothetical protein